MKRPILILALLSLSLPFPLRAANSPASAAKPNFLLIFVDNLGYGDLGCYGNRENKTPHIDRLAREGARCTDFYIASPSCSPSRGAILTGRHPLRNGLNYQLSTGEGNGTEGAARHRAHHSAVSQMARLRDRSLWKVEHRLLSRSTAHRAWLRRVPRSQVGEYPLLQASLPRRKRLAARHGGPEPPGRIFHRSVCGCGD